MIFIDAFLSSWTFWGRHESCLRVSVYRTLPVNYVLALPFGRHHSQLPSMYQQKNPHTHLSKLIAAKENYNNNNNYYYYYYIYNCYDFLFFFFFNFFYCHVVRLFIEEQCFLSEWVSECWFTLVLFAAERWNLLFWCSLQSNHQFVHVVCSCTKFIGYIIQAWWAPPMCFTPIQQSVFLCFEYSYLPSA
jgi:hypothetical protein